MRDRRRAPSRRPGRTAASPARTSRRAQVVFRARAARAPGGARHDRVARHRRGHASTASCASRSSRPATSCVDRHAARRRRDLRQQPLHALRHARRASTATSLDMGVVPDVPEALERAFADAAGERRRRHHLRRRVGRRGRLRQAAARQAGRGAVLEDRDEAGPAARLRQDRRRAFLRPAGQPGVGDGDVLPVRARRAARCCRAGATSRRCRRSRRRWRRRSARRRAAPSSSAASSRADGGGGWTVRTTGDQGSGILSSMSQANCFIVLSADTGNVRRGRARRRAAARRADLTSRRAR